LTVAERSARMSTQLTAGYDKAQDYLVMPAPVAGIHVLLIHLLKKEDVDGRDRARP
jgi:hypothetical protein